ncbi:glucan synthase subunit [Scheffersomyces xylosifermentans]|uniref:glucan synthase subunit n=1 Tax=Scheffersomyces xylosifermentans TaxID=1304137 RepID=UPI00315C934C
MQHRDLTYNTPRFQLDPASNSEEELLPPASLTLRNPFEEDESSFVSREDSEFTTGSQDHNNNAYSNNDEPYGARPVSFQNSEYNSSTIPSPRGPQVMSEFDRYPSMHSIANSRVASYASFNNIQPNGYDNSDPENRSQVSTDNHGGFTDFSPFGGYPASSFPLYIDEKEDDDYLHNPDPVYDALYDKNRFIYDLRTMDRRSLNGLLGFVGLLIAALLVFILLPVLTFSGIGRPTSNSFEVLTEYTYPLLSGIRTSLVDPDTPEEARTYTAKDGNKWVLVFSDEFNAEGRTFYEGDDQFFTAVDLHYDATKDLEWYDPDAASTANGTLNLRMDAFKNHDLFYRSGMVQSWNKMCFTEGKIEFSARLPHYGNISGLWPGMWTMGNLGRPGYLASTEGVWPYTYDSCDVGITPNQSSPDGISYLPGQRLNKCTCPGEDHPNPGVGRGAPEIDALEGEISGGLGRVSQSLQVAPYDIWYMPDYDFIEIHNYSVTTMNTYTGGPFQQALSAVTSLNLTWYERGDYTHNFQKYGYEYLNDDKDGYIRWFVGDDPTYTVYVNSLHPNGNIGWRKIPKEPISMIMNLGISNNWAYIDWQSLIFPATLRVDYVRVYQPSDNIKLSCDPPDYPTAEYIQQHLNIYQNVNLTRFRDGGYEFPKNKLVHNC